MTSPIGPTVEPLRWGFIGAGMVATAALGPAVHAARGAVLQAAAARDLDRALALGPKRAYNRYIDVLDDDDVDAVYISLSNEAHLPWTLAALRAGKHVLCEKPLGLTAAEVDEMGAAAGDLLIVEASWYRWHPRIRIAQRRLAEIGPVRHVSAGFTFGGQLDGNYRLDPTRGGGALYDVGCYAVSACLWSIDRGLPNTVSAEWELAATGVDTDTRAIMRWSAPGVGDAEAEIHVGITADESQWLVITGDEGTIEMRDAPYTSWKDDHTELVITRSASMDRIQVAAVDPYRVMVEEFSSVVRGGPGWILPLAESRMTAALIDAARTSAALGGRTVQTGDADTMLRGRKSL